MGRARRRSDRKREGWWREAPSWAWIVMVVSTVSIAVLAPLAAGRGQVAQSQLDRLNTQDTPTAVATATTTAPEDARPASIVVIGDTDTGGSAEGGNDEAGWPALLEARLPEVPVEAISAPGAGYVAVDPESGQTFSDVTDNAPVPGAAAVIVFGSRNDGSGIAGQVGEAALSTLNKIRLRAPAAQLIVVGPLWPSSVVPAGVRNNRDVISAAADTVGARFVDPIADGWLVDLPGSIGSDGINLTDAGHTLVADRMEPIVREALQL